MSGAELLIILLVALLVLGPKQLPQIARFLGKTIAYFKRAQGAIEREYQSQCQIAQLQDNIARAKQAESRLQAKNNSTESFSENAKLKETNSYARTEQPDQLK